MRKSINGLSLIVLEEMGMAFQLDRLFVFVSRCGKRLKLIYWDQTGFALWYKRLEKQRFKWPKRHEEEVILSNSDQLEQLLFEKSARYVLSATAIWGRFCGFFWQ